MDEVKIDRCACSPDVTMGSYRNQVRVDNPPPHLGVTRPPIGIDRCIYDEVASLWDRGIRTIASCCGHNVAPAVISVADEDAARMESMGYRAHDEAPATFIAKSVNEISSAVLRERRTMHEMLVAAVAGARAEMADAAEALAEKFACPGNHGGPCQSRAANLALRKLAAGVRTLIPDGVTTEADRVVNNVLAALDDEPITQSEIDEAVKSYDVRVLAQQLRARIARRDERERIAAFVPSVFIVADRENPDGPMIPLREAILRGDHMHDGGDDGALG